MDRSKVSIGLVICGGLITIGCLLPWATALGGLIKLNGTDTDDGKIVLIFGLVILVTGLVVHPSRSPKRYMYVIALIFSCLSSFISIFHIIDIGSLTADTPLASIGIGLYLCVIASVGSLVVSCKGINPALQREQTSS